MDRPERFRPAPPIGPPRGAASDERRARLAERIEQRRYSVAVPAVVQQLNGLGIPVTDADAVPKERVEAAWQAVEEDEVYHRVWHRVWGVRLRAEVLEVAARIGTAFAGERAVVVWGSVTPVGFTLSAETALRRLPAHVGPDADGVWGPGPASDLLMVSEDGASGLYLTYAHYGFEDAYELRPWGDYAISVGR